MTIKIQEIQGKLSLHDKEEEVYILDGLNGLKLDDDINYEIIEAQIHIEYLSSLVDMMTLFIKENITGVFDNET